MGIRRVFGVIVLMASLVSLVLADESSPTEYYESASFGSEILWLTKDQLVSGTNVNFKVGFYSNEGGALLRQATARSIVPLSVDSVRVMEYKILVGGQQVHHVTTPGPANGPHPSTQVRFASTHFPNGSTIPIKVEAKFKFARMGTVKDHTFSINVKVHNEAIMLATTESVVQGPPPNCPFLGYEVRATDNAFAVAAQAAVAATIPIITGAEVNHTSYASAASAKTWRKSEGSLRLDEKLKTATFLHFATHGESALFRSSFGDSVAFGTGGLSELHTLSQSGRTVPGVNMVIFHACSTLTDQGDVLNALDMNGKTNRAVAGYNGVIYYELAEPWDDPDNPGAGSTKTLDYHAQRLFQRLAAGDPLLVAKRSLEEVPVNGMGVFLAGVSGSGCSMSKGSRIPMIIAIGSDRYSRISQVYLEEQLYLQLASNPSRRNNWFYIF